MADADTSRASAPSSTATATIQPARVPTNGTKLGPLPIPQSVADLRTRMQDTAVFSPVNQNGSFEFDRVIKSGDILKRTRKTKTWRPIHIVLRPNVVSLYRDKDETKLRHQINLSELTAVARQKDPKGKVQHVFGLFLPSRNYHLAARTEKDAQDWVELIRNEARIDEEEDEMTPLSPCGNGREAFEGLGRLSENRKEAIVSSSSEAELGPRPKSAVTPGSMHSARRPSHALTYSGNEYGSLSDFSDTMAPGGFRGSNVSLSTANAEGSRHQEEVERVYGLDRPKATRNTSQLSGFGANPDAERVIYHGWLYALRSKGGVRRWKKLWVVLRPKNLALYKNEEEYSATLIIPFPSIIDAVDIDPISKSKRYCMQIITEERNYRFCAADDDSLAQWLGSLKSVLAKRKEAKRDLEKENDRVTALAHVQAQASQ